MCKFGAHRTTPTAKKWDSRGDIFAMTKMGRVSGFWRFLGKYLGTGPKIPYWEPTGENPWISGPEYIPTLSLGDPWVEDTSLSLLLGSALNKLRGSPAHSMFEVLLYPLWFFFPCILEGKH